MATVSGVEQLQAFKVRKGESTVSGLSSGAFMTVQLHVAHSGSFCGAGVIAGGPYRCVETFRGAAPLAEDAFEVNALQLCMSPLIPRTAPDGRHLAELARETAQAERIDPVGNLKDDRVYVFTGSRDTVVKSLVVEQTRDFYLALGVRPENLHYEDTVPAGHSIITMNPEDSPLDANLPPYLNQGDFIQSHRILLHLYPDLDEAVTQATGRLIRFDQSEFFDHDVRASMSPYAYAYVPRAVEEGAEARVHVALHGCKQGYRYVDFEYGQADTANQPPYGNRYVTTTGYNEMADANNLIILYPQAQGSDDATVQNPDGCWDWWGYTAVDTEAPDYYSRDALQIRALHAMLERLGG